MASREALDKAAKLESELAAMKEAADPKLAKVQAASWKREAASRAKLEQLQQEMEELRKSLAQAAASSVEKDKQLVQAKEQADNVMHQLAWELEPAIDVVRGCVQGRWIRLNERDQQHVEGVCQKLCDVQRQLKQQEC